MLDMAVTYFKHLKAAAAGASTQVGQAAARIEGEPERSCDGDSAALSLGCHPAVARGVQVR